MSLLTLDPRSRVPRSSTMHPGPDPRADHAREVAAGPRPRVAGEAGRRTGEAVEFARLLAATLAFYAAMVVAPLILLAPIALLGLALGLVGLLVGG